MSATSAADSARPLRPAAIALGAMTPDSRLLAGGTDLVRAMTQQRHRPDLIVDLSAMTEPDHARSATACCEWGR